MSGKWVRRDRIVDQNQVAVLEGEGLDRRLEPKAASPRGGPEYASPGPGFALAIEDGAGIILSFLDVGERLVRPRTAPHLLGDGDEKVLENLHSIASRAFVMIFSG
jgi:hypothetical protein